MAADMRLLGPAGQRGSTAMTTTEAYRPARERRRQLFRFSMITKEKVPYKEPFLTR
jgi:hypothetical protein